jgi:hypothetical protein
MRFLLFVFAIMLYGCSGYSQQKNVGTSTTAKVQVYFFHGTNRCSGCLNAEKASVQVLNELYKDQLEKGIIAFESVNIEEDKNKALAEKYEVAWNMLLFVKSDGTKKELTQQAFSYGSNPEALKPLIKTTVDEMLK